LGGRASSICRKDFWNLENFSLLGPNRIARHIDIVARVYPRYSSGEPVLVFFDLKTKYGGVILKSPIVEAPTVIYIPQSFFLLLLTLLTTDTAMFPPILYILPV
jgi:hypothetical protein